MGEVGPGALASQRRSWPFSAASGWLPGGHMAEKNPFTSERGKSEEDSPLVGSLLSPCDKTRANVHWVIARQNRNLVAAILLGSGHD